MIRLDCEFKLISCDMVNFSSRDKMSHSFTNSLKELMIDLPSQSKGCVTERFKVSAMAG